MFTTTLFALGAFLTTAFASPIARANTLTAANIIALNSTTTTCDHQLATGECRTAYVAAPYIALSYTNFGIPDFPSQAAILALILYETGAFQYSTNHFPGIPGQGTRNMMDPQDVQAYATWLSTTCQNCGITPAQVQAAEAEGPAAVLDLVNGNMWGFGSAAWFLATQCDESVKQELATGTMAGWQAYLGCLRADGNAERDRIWNAAIALKGW